ncbi:uncharacterized protein LOC142817610 [Rhipicephalus microplus]|uniref:uncharacterized protein LOC142817610 n=1 Tax=Rhipicephalus microplus TaxID=6941 RepID=UPI003F6C08E0
MCWSSTKTTLLVAAVACMCMNGFNLVSRMTGIKDKIREEEFSSYLPDVTDISKWVNGRENSDHITEGLAGVSLIFDVMLLGGAMKESANLIQISGLWGSFDCVADAVIGFLAANYTVPTIAHEETRTVSKTGFRKRSLKRRHRAKDFPKMLPLKASGPPDDKDEKKDDKSYKFFSRSQLEKESVRAFLIEIRRIADKCNFGSSLDRMIWDSIVCGVRSSVVVESKLVVLDCVGPSLCGRDLINVLDQAGVSILQVEKEVAQGTVQAISHDNNRAEYPDVFSEELGLINGPPASLMLKEGAVPKF